MLTPIEKGAFLKLFNRGGYVLDFSTADFDAFTLESVGIALCEHYELSKGASLKAFVAAGDYKLANKLLYDLFQYYELNFQDEIDGRNTYRTEFTQLYKKCKEIANIKWGKGSSVKIVQEIKAKMNSEYITSQVDLMISMQKSNPTEAIGKAKELIESCCKTILENSNITLNTKWDINDLVNETITLLNLSPKNISNQLPLSDTLKQILGNLRAISVGIAALRNAYGGGHGKSANYKGLEERHAKLAIGSAGTLVNFLWDSFELQGGKIK